MKACTPAHDALIAIVMSKRLIKKVPYFHNSRSTAELENFQNLILKYAPKRLSYKPPAYRGRNILAALDSNAHCQRKVFTNKDGSIRYQRYHSKTGMRWSAYGIKEHKTYPYAQELITTIVNKRLTGDVSMRQRAELHPEDPRNISPVLAPTQPPPTAELVAQKISRFTTHDSDETEDYTYSDH